MGFRGKSGTNSKSPRAGHQEQRPGRGAEPRVPTSCPQSRTPDASGLGWPVLPPLAPGLFLVPPPLLATLPLVSLLPPCPLPPAPSPWVPCLSPSLPPSPLPPSSVPLLPPASPSSCLHAPVPHSHRLSPGARPNWAQNAVTMTRGRGEAAGTGKDRVTRTGPLGEHGLPQEAPGLASRRGPEERRAVQAAGAGLQGGGRSPCGGGGKPMWGSPTAGPGWAGAAAGTKGEAPGFYPGGPGASGPIREGGPVASVASPSVPMPWPPKHTGLPALMHANWEPRGDTAPSPSAVPAAPSAPQRARRPSTAPPLLLRPAPPTSLLSRTFVELAACAGTAGVVVSTAANGETRCARGRPVPGRGDRGLTRGRIYNPTGGPARWRKTQRGDEHTRAAWPRR